MEGDAHHAHRVPALRFAQAAASGVPVLRDVQRALLRRRGTLRTPGLNRHSMASPRNRSEQRPVDELAATMENILGVELDLGMIRHALTHRSYAYENGGIPNNERLEFLGDRVLGLNAGADETQRPPDVRVASLPAPRFPLRNSYGP